MTKKKKHENLNEEVEKECQCEEGCECGENCECGDDCHCHEDHECHCHDKQSDLAAEYLAVAQRLQADFENYRKRVAEQLDRERQEGVKSVIEAFLPSLDTFKEAKKGISDESILAGINMIEDKILEALKNLHCEKIESVGAKFDPNLHNVIALLNNPNEEDDTILEEYQSGWMLNGKVIRYAKVIVNKKS